LITNNKLKTGSDNSPQLQKNLEILTDIFGAEDILKYDWRKIEFTTDAAVTDLQIPHTAQYTPTDILTTQTSGNITFNFNAFTDKFLVVTTAGAATFRGLVGRYRENTE